MTLRLIALGLLLSVAACGETQTGVVVTVNLGGLTVPNQIDALHFTISDQVGLANEGTFALTPNEEATLVLTPGAQTQNLVTINVDGWLHLRQADQATCTLAAQCDIGFGCATYLGGICAQQTLVAQGSAMTTIVADSIEAASVDLLPAGP